MCDRVPCACGDCDHYWEHLEWDDIGGEYHCPRCGMMQFLHYDEHWDEDSGEEYQFWYMHACT